MAVPDASIHPHATGPALKIVEAHSAPQDLIFYSGWFCPFNQRVWVALEEKGIQYEYREVNPYHKAKEFLAINPKGLVPAIEHQGTDFAYTIDYISKKIIPTFFKLVQAQDKAAQDDARKDLYDSLKEVSEKVKGPFFAGAEFGAVDLSLAPFLMRVYILEKHRNFKAADAGDKFVKWLEAVTSRPSMISTTSDKEHYEEMYARYLANEAQSEMAKSTRGEKSHV
ncbi:hypothetical protein RQP46_002162 [Phenoliferia psychrophenolica]